MGQIQAAGIAKVDCEGFMAAIAHNVLKLVRRLGRAVGPPGPALPQAVEISESGSTLYDAAPDYDAAPQYQLRQRRLINGPGLRI